MEHGQKLYAAKTVSWPGATPFSAHVCAPNPSGLRRSLPATKAIERSVLPLVVRVIWNTNGSASRQQVRGWRFRKKFKGSLPECAPDLFWWLSERTHLGTCCFPNNTPPIGKAQGSRRRRRRSSISKNKASATLLEGRPGMCKEETKHVAACRNEKASHASVGEHAQSR